MLNVIAGGLLFIVSVFSGFAVEKYFVKRKKNLESFCELIDFVELKIDVYGEDVAGIMEEYHVKKPSDVSEYCIKATRGEEYKSGFLSIEERKLLSEFLRETGESDSAAQKRLFDAYRKRICAALKVAEENKNKKGVLAKKISPLIGLGVFLLVL